MDQTFAIDETFRAYAAALLRHHSLLEQGEEVGPEAEDTEELLSDLWDKLNDTQRRQVRGLSSDLNWLHRKYAPPPLGRKREDVTPEELSEFYRLNEGQECVPLLSTLRVCAAALSPALVTSVRAKCYSRLGLEAVADLFDQAASELSRHDGKVSRMGPLASRASAPGKLLVVEYLE